MVKFSNGLREFLEKVVQYLDIDEMRRKMIITNKKISRQSGRLALFWLLQGMSMLIPLSCEGTPLVAGQQEYGFSLSCDLIQQNNGC